MASKNKRCDGCGYCTQTDKAGKRKPLYITVKADNERNLCPLFPGFYYCWDSLDQEMAESFILYLEFIDKVVGDM